MEDVGDFANRKELLKDYSFDGLDTCAVDGMCAVNCPVDINTGDLVKRLRKENHSSFQNWVAKKVAKHFALVESILRFAFSSSLLANKVFGKNFITNLTKGIKRAIPEFPQWSNQIQRPASTLHSYKSINSNLEVVYFTTCISRMMGGETGDNFMTICKRADISVVIPESINGTCCGQLFSSKGFTDAFRDTANATIQKLWKSSNEGSLPIVLDVTSCTQTVKTYGLYLTKENKACYDKMTFIDVIDFTADHVISRVQITKPKERIVFHPVCSVTKMGSLSKLQSIGKACATQADFPVFAGCCGMAGDRGFYYPQLTKSATSKEVTEVNQTSYDGYYSSSRTCEMALSESSGKNYASILKLLVEVTV
jgi:D-lactate dehydrogenase